jgi:DNA-binding NarL/FixJ family response regulator
MATAEKIYVGIDGERVELTGAQLTAFKAQRTKDAAEAKKQQDEIEAKATARASALAKLAALGLTEEEIAAL